MTVAARTCCPTCVKTSVVRILSAFPVSPIISGSQRTENTSPMTGSMVLKGSRTSSRGPFMNLCTQRVSSARTTAGGGI